MNKEIKILLPETLYIKKMRKQSGIIGLHEEYNLYFQNFIQPYNDAWDVQVRCQFGINLGHVWRLADFQEDVQSFDLEIVIYDEYGESLASKKVQIVPVERKESPKSKVLFFGDSMTHSRIYVRHVVESLSGIETIGSRCFEGNLRVEGRGGWSYAAYFERYYEKFGMSPFLFPKGVAGRDYYGDKSFIDKTREGDPNVYLYYGYDYAPLRDGQYFSQDQMLYRREGEENRLISDSPEFEFDLAKYFERFRLDTPDVFSILLGANDLQICPYEDSARRVAQYIENTKRLVDEIRRCDPAIKIVINLPVTGAEQYAWGKRLGCQGSGKMYRFNILRATEELIRTFDGRQKEGIFLSPMHAVIDPRHGFPHIFERANRYCDTTEERQSNWVHPNESGYRQMGDALAAVIEYIR